MSARGYIPASENADAYASMKAMTTLRPVQELALARARFTIESERRREAEISRRPITSSAGRAEAQTVLDTVRARIEGMRIFGSVPPGPALSAALGVATDVTVRMREWDESRVAALDIRIASLRAALRTGAEGDGLQILTDTTKPRR